ncbi:FecR domain-containing protein [Brevundimonas sp.]|uniref:FecR family protein n=1 Tax=Brevundimonas sp. TaxID=1871086 RepID=UPI00351DA762
MIQRLTSLFDRRPRTAEEWLARMRRPTVHARDQAAFLDWLEQDDNLQAYENAKARLAGLAPLAGAFEGDLARLRARKPATVGRRILIGGLATSAVAAIVALMILPGQGRQIADERVVLYASAPGEITDLALEDGSRVTLDADTQIQVRFEQDARRVVLLRGAAYFDVAHNPARPFQVAVADRNVIVTGTRFVTTLRQNRAEVSLLEGRVAIGRHDVGKRRALDRAVMLAPGQKAVFAPGLDRVQLSRPDVESATAWRERRLIFHDAPLSDVIAEAARYADKPMVIVDPALAKMKVTVVLPLTGQVGLIDRMDDLLPISIERTSDGRALIRGD